MSDVTIRFTRRQAQGLGLLVCKHCGWDQESHSKFGPMRARLGVGELCENYEEVVRTGTLAPEVERMEALVTTSLQTERDALRYRFLKSRLGVPGAMMYFLRLNNWHPDTDLRDVDAALDRAMDEHEPQNDER